MNENDILVSIIIPTYNRFHLIGESIQSVLDQTHQNWELIIVDDGSTDGTKDLILDKFQDKRIFYYFTRHSGVLSSVRNHGIQKSKGAFIAFLDSDDVWVPDKLSYQLELLKQHSDADFIIGHGAQFGKDAIPPPWQEPFFKGSHFLPVLTGRFVFYLPTLMFNRKVISNVGLINENMISAGEIDFFLHMSLHYKGIFTNEIVLKIRKHDHSTSNKLQTLSYLEHLKIVAHFRDTGDLNKKQYIKLASELHYKTGLLNIKNHRITEARKNFIQYVSLNPWRYKGWIRYLQAAIGAFITSLNKGTATPGTGRQ